MKRFTITRVAVLKNGSRRSRIVAKGEGLKAYTKAVDAIGGPFGLAFYFPMPSKDELSVQYVTDGI